MRAAVLGIEPVVRVAERVHVAHGSGDLPGRQVEDFRGERRIEIAVGARLDPGVARLVDQRRQPADFQVAPDHHQQIRLVQLQHEARLGLDEVRILVAAGERFDGDLVAADLADDRRQVARRGDDVEAGRFGAANRDEQRGADERGDDAMSVS